MRELRLDSKFSVVIFDNKENILKNSYALIHDGECYLMSKNGSIMGTIVFLEDYFGFILRGKKEVLNFDKALTTREDVYLKLLAISETYFS